MRRENLSACFTLLLLFFTALAQPNFTVSATPNIIRVPQDYPTIQEAINAATSGDTILVAAGTYYEHVIINKTVSLKGEGPNVSVIDGNSVGDIVTITANNTRIEGFTMANGGMNIIGYGILVKGSNNLVVNNSITGVWYGIGTSSSSSSNTIMGNNFSVVPRPLDIDGSNNLIKEHFISHTGFAFTVFLSGFHNTLFNNTIIADGWVLTIASSQYCTVSDNNIIRMGYTGSEAGIWIWNSQFNTIINNTIKNHSVGILIEGDSSNNIIYHNNFRNNIKQAVAPEPVTNIWDDGYPSGGNYWSDYTGIDANNDGIGDTPYIINASNIDHYPLMYPYYTHLPVGDITGPADMPDGKVDMYDVGLAAYAFGSYPGHERWRPAADITGPD